MNKAVKTKKKMEKKIVSDLNKNKKINRKTNIMCGYILTFTVIVGICTFLSLTVLFKTKKIDVQGDTIYSQEEIIEKSGVKVGSNIFLFNTKASEENIQKNLPYIEKAKLVRVFPNKMVIQTQTAQESSCFETSLGYAVLSGSGKVLRLGDDLPDEVMVVKGVGLKKFCLGEKAEYENEEKGKMLEELLQLLKENGLLKTTGVDFTSATNIVVCYEGRINVNFGLYEDMGYKIRTATEIINGKLGTNDQGILDLSTLSKDNRSYFSPKVINQPDC